MDVRAHTTCAPATRLCMRFAIVPMQCDTFLCAYILLLLVTARIIANIQVSPLIACGMTAIVTSQDFMQ